MTQPLDGSSEEERARHEAAAPSPESNPPTVWVIDDDQMILDSVRLVLEGEGYRVETSLEGAPLRELAASRRPAPNMILLDVLLAGENGLELCRLIKSSARGGHVPVVLFSANSQLGPQVAQECGDDYLAKPFDIDDLIAMVHRFTGPPEPADDD